MFVQIDVTADLKDYIQEQMPALVRDYLLGDGKSEINKMIKDCVKSQFRATANDILQNKDVRAMMTDKVMDVINNKDDKYKKCLEEIKNIAVNCVRQDSCNHCDYEGECTNFGGIESFLSSKIRGINE